MSAIAFDAAAVLAAHRAMAPPAKPANAANPVPPLAALAALAGGAVFASHGVEGRRPAGWEASYLPDPPAHATDAVAAVAVLDDWRAGVARLAVMPSPAGIEPRRWAIYCATLARMLARHGAVLHAAGWSTLDVFGLHPCAPARFPPGWGLAWLLDEVGDVLDVSADAIGLRRIPGGARMVFRRRVPVSGMAAAWELPQGAP